jgi:hypothetical protein
MKQWILFGFLMLAGVSANAQLETGADFRRQVYDDELTYGLTMHTRGYAASFRRMKFQDGFNKYGFELEIAGLRHPKQVNVPNIGMANRSWVFNKINGLTALRAGYGRERVFVDKTDRSSISISWVLFGGLSLGVVKPVYVEVLMESSNFLTTERYDPTIHTINVQGQAPYFVGLAKSSLRPGLYVKNGFNFDYNFLDEKVTALEVGFVVDYFPTWFGAYESTVPIMFDSRNYSLFFQFYLTFNFGKKWN